MSKSEVKQALLKLIREHDGDNVPSLLLVSFWNHFINKVTTEELEKFNLKYEAAEKIIECDMRSEMEREMESKQKKVDNLLYFPDKDKH